MMADQKMRYVSIDEMLKIVGSFHRFQWILDAIFCITMFPGTLQVLIMYFASLQPEWKCVSNSTLCNMNATYPATDERRCTLPRSEWEYTEPSSFSIATTFDIYCEKDWMLHITISALFLGWAIGAVMLGWLADNYGRKFVMYPSLAILMLLGFTNAFVNNIILFMVFRFFIGFFVPGISVQMFILISEVVGNKHRPLAGIILWFFFALALCLLGLLAYFIREWKTLFLANSIPYIFTLFFYLYTPESIRWLQLHKKEDQLKSTLERIAAWNGRNIPENTVVAPIKTTEDNKTSPLDLFSSFSMARSTLVQGFAWFSYGMVYYGLSLASDDLGGSLYLNYVLASAIEFPAVILAVFFCDKFGRKRTVIYPSFIAAIACFLVALIPATGNMKIARVTMGMLGKLCVSLAFDAIYTWSVEIFTTDIRAVGMGFLQVTSRIGAASSPWIAKSLKKIHITVPFIVMGIITLVSAVFLFVLSETKGKESDDENISKNGIKHEVELDHLIGEN